MTNKQIEFFMLKNFNNLFNILQIYKQNLANSENKRHLKIYLNLP